MNKAPAALVKYLFNISFSTNQKFNAAMWNLQFNHLFHPVPFKVLSVFFIAVGSVREQIFRGFPENRSIGRWSARTYKKSNFRIDLMEMREGPVNKKCEICGGEA